MKILKTILICFIITAGHAQHGVGLLHLGDNIIQSNQLNAALIPYEGTFFLGLPGISNLSLGYNNRFDYATTFTPNPETGNPRIDTKSIGDNLKKNNYLSFKGSISTLFLGFRANPQSMTTYIFANEVADLHWSYAQDEFNFLLNGNEPGSKYDFEKLKFHARWYREIGLGISVPLSSYRMSVGARIKRLYGILDASLHPKYNAQVNTSVDNYQIDFFYENAIFRTSGVQDILDNNFDNRPTSMANGGWGADLGLHWRMNDFYSLSAAVNNLGYIRWKEGNTIYAVTNAELDYTGADLSNDSVNFEQIVQDSLLNLFETSETQEAYTTWLHPNMNLSGTVHLDKDNEIKATFITHFIYGKFRNVYGLGYLRKVGRWLRVNVNAVKTPQNFLDLGGAVSMTTGFLQFHLAVDQTLDYRNMTRFKQADVSFGINFIFGRPKPPKKQKEEDSPYNDPDWLEHPSRPTPPTVVTEKDGKIYSLIKKLAPPEKWEKWVTGKNKEEKHKNSVKEAQYYKKKRYKYKAPKTK